MLTYYGRRVRAKMREGAKKKFHLKLGSVSKPAEPEGIPTPMMLFFGLKQHPSTDWQKEATYSQAWVRTSLLARAGDGPVN
jgi:hypothetical protein